MRLLLAALFLMLASSQAMATNYYACDCQTDADPDCTAGDDARVTPTAALPWQTLGELRDQFDLTTAGGDNYYFCSGGSFLITATGNWKGNCESGVACEIDEYVPTWGTGDEADPIILGNGFTAFIFDNDGSNDVRGNVNISNLDIRGNRNEDRNGIGSDAPIRNITIDSVRASGFRNGVQVIVGNDDVIACTAYTDEGDGTSDLTCPSHGLVATDPIFLDGNFRDFALQGVTTTVTSVVDANTITVTADPTGGASLSFDVIECGAGGNCRNQDWTVTNSDLYENARKAVGGNYDGLTLQNNNIHHNGGSDIGTPADRDHGVYVGGRRLLIENNNLWSNVGDPWSVNNGGANPDNPDNECSGSIINVNGTTEYGIMDDITIRGNHVWEQQGTAGGSCWGIAVEAGSSSREEYTGVTIEKNVIWNVGRRGITAGSISAGGVVQNNQIGWGGTTPGFSVNGIWLAGKGGIDADDALAADVIIRNNSVYTDSNVTDTLSAIRVNDDITDEEGADGWVVANNAAMQDGNGDLNCLVFGGVEGDFTTVSNNACEENGTGSLDWVVGVVAGITDHATSASCVADPDHTWCGGDQTSFAFEDTTFPDFVLRPATLGDNLVDNGTGSAPTDDINGKTRSTLDIGAYEFIDTTERYWVTGGDGNWSNTNNWAATSGGSSPASVPDADTVATVDGNSGTGTITLDVDAITRDFVVTSASGVATLAFGAQELKCERDCTINDPIAITATSGTGILSVGRNLDTVGVVFTGVDDISINLYGPGFWEYDPASTTDIDIDDLTVAQDGWTTVLKQNGPATPGSSDINIHGQWFLGPGYLDYDLSLETGNDDVPIVEFQNENEDFRMMFDWGTIPDMEVEWEDSSGDRSVISHRAIYDGTTLDIKGGATGLPGAGHHFWFSGDIDLNGGIFWFNKNASLYQKGHSLTAGTARISFNLNSNDWYLEGGTVAITNEFRVSAAGGRSILDLGTGGTFTAGYLRTETEPLYLSGGVGSVFEVTDATPGTCSTHRYVDPDAAGGGDGSIGTPWNDWTNVQANLTAGTDCVYFDKATTLDIGGASNDLIGAGTGGILGAYGTGASPVLSLDAAEQFDIDNDVYIYEARFEFGFAAAVTTIFAPWLVP